MTDPGTESVQLPTGRDRSRSQRILRRLALLGPGPAAFYADAESLAFEPGHELRAGFHFVAHALREVDSALRTVLRPSGFVKPLEASHRAEIRAVCEWLGFGEADPILDGWIRLARPSQSHAHRRSLAAPVANSSKAREFVEEWEAILDPVLERYEAKYVAAVPRLTALAAKPVPTAADIDELRNHLPNNLNALTIFFENLTSAHWLVPLAEAGYFDAPPEPETDTEAGTIRFPAWPAGEYLVRVCDSDLAFTASILERTATHYNFRVSDVLFTCALKLAPDDTAALCPRMREWVDVAFLGVVSDKAVAVVEHLITGGHNEAAFDLAAALLDANLAIKEGSDDGRA